MHQSIICQPLERRRFLAAGELDPFFGDAGVFKDPTPSPYLDFYDMAVLPDARIVVLGESATNLYLIRFQRDGTPDSTFGNDASRPGYLALDMLPDDPTTLLAQPDGKLLIGTTTQLFRFNSDGSTDLSFGEDGTADLNMHVNDFALQADGSIIAGGQQFDTHKLEVTRLDATGRVDATFGAGGTVVMDIGPGYDSADAVAVDSTGNVVVAGERVHVAVDPDDFTNGEIFVMRLTPSGQIDAAFPHRQLGGSDGTLKITDTSVDAQGRIYALISGGPNNLDRLNPDSSFDQSFNGGIVHFGDTMDVSRFAIEDNGAIVVAGAIEDPNSTDFARDLALARVNSDGTLDTTFSGDGVARTHLFNADQVFRSVAIARDGSILALGSVSHDASRFGQGILARYWSSAAPAAEVEARPVRSAGGTRYRFSVTYRDNGDIDHRTLDSQDLRVYMPDGSTRRAYFKQFLQTSDGSLRTAIYQFPAPGGSWDAADNGEYTIQLRGHQVADTKGHFASARVIGSFRVRISAPLPAASAAMPAKSSPRQEESLAMSLGI